VFTLRRSADMPGWGRTVEIQLDTAIGEGCCTYLERDLDQTYLLGLMFDLARDRLKRTDLRYLL
jgi:hypothetical protein